MINLKKIGLTALAGSLVAISANAVEMSVSGTSEISYISKGGTGIAGYGATDVEGNPWGSNTSIKFSGSGDVGFGTATIVRTLNDGLGSHLSQYTTINMDDLGTISFDSSGGGLEGLTAKDDLLPTAYEEAWNGVSSSGVSGAASNNTWGYSNSVMGLDISLAHTKGGAGGTGDQATSGAGLTGSTTDIYLSHTGMIEGLTLAVGNSQAELKDGLATTTDSSTTLGRAVYAMGPVSVGYQVAEVNNGGAGAATTDIAGYSIAFNVNDNLSVSYGRYDKESAAIGATAAVTEESTGISGAYTSGAATVRFTSNEASNAGNAVGRTQEHTEISLVLAF
jgi:outer membrane protein OmpU